MTALYEYDTALGQALSDLVDAIADPENASVVCEELVAEVNRLGEEELDYFFILLDEAEKLLAQLWHSIEVVVVADDEEVTPEAPPRP